MNHATCNVLYSRQTMKKKNTYNKPMFNMLLQKVVHVLLKYDKLTSEKPLNYDGKVWPVVPCIINDAQFENLWQSL